MSSIAPFPTWDAFIKNGLPTRKNERWKYTDLSFLMSTPFARFDKEKLAALKIDDIEDAIQQHRLRHVDSILLVCVNGHFISELSDMTKLPTGMLVSNFANAPFAILNVQDIHEQHAEHYPFVGANAALSTDDLFLYVPENCELEQPVHLLSLTVGEEDFMAHPRHHIVLGKHSKLTLVEEYFTHAEFAYLTNIVTTISVDQGASFEYCKMQHEGSKATHLAHTFIWQKENSQVNLTNISVGAKFAREEIVVALQEPGADCRTSGFYHTRRLGQYLDHHIDITHRAPRSTSDMLYKGILDNQSRAVFNGRLHVEPDAQKILAHQANHNLLLSNEAEVYSKPELEIYADDVKCKHGASTGQIDQDALFYLRSRGIEKREALDILLQGFAEEILQRIAHPSIRVRAEELM